MKRTKFIKEANCSRCNSIINLRRTNNKHLERISTYSSDGETTAISKDVWYCDPCWNAK